MPLTAQQAPYFPMDAVHAVVRQAVRQSLRHFASDDPLVGTIAEVSKIYGSINYGVIFDKAGVQLVWDSFRESTTAIEWLMSVCQLVLGRLSQGMLDWTTIVDAMVNAYAQFNIPGNAVDDDTRIRMPDSTVMEELYTNNPWFVVLLLIHQAQALKLSGIATPEEPV